MSRFGCGLLVAVAVAVAVAVVGVAAWASAAASPLPKVLSCSGKALLRPAGTVVLSCADGNSELRRTRWSAWGPRAALGATDFGVNLCTPTCAASRMSFFPHSSVRLGGVTRSRQGLFFSRAVITYVRHGKTETFVANLPTRPL